MQCRIVSTIATLLSTLFLMVLWLSPDIAWWQPCLLTIFLSGTIERMREWEHRVFPPVPPPVPLPLPVRLTRVK